MASLENSQQPVNKFSTRTQNPKVTQKWDTLQEEAYFKVNICAFKNPSDFLVRRMDSAEVINKLQQLETIIFTFVEANKTPVSDFKIGEDCLASFDGSYLRAKIQDMEAWEKETILEVFSCDFGISSRCYAKDVYETSNEIISFMPFQAIQCKLIGELFCLSQEE